jgi:predicted permease
MLLKRPGTSALAIFALALGIGLTTTMFSIVEGAFLRGLPFEHSERIMHLEPRRGASASSGATAIADFADWRASQQSFEELAATTSQMSTLAGDSESADRFPSAAITPNLLHLLRVRPVAGRDFTDADAQPGAPKVAIISDRIWRERFHGDGLIVGRVVRIDGAATTVIGIAPPKFGFPEVEQLWTPLNVTPGATRTGGTAVQVVGRLRADVSLARAQVEVRGIGDRLAATYPENKGTTVAVEPFLTHFLGGNAVMTLTTMLGAVLGVFLIACVNVTNLQLARAADRMREVAVRTALGATRFRIVRQMVVEGLVLSTVGAAIGLAIATVGSAAFNRAIVDTQPPFWIDARVDSRVLLVVTGLAVLAALAAALVPALRVSRQPVSDVLKDEGRGSTSLRIGRLSRGLVIVEMTCSFGLLVVSGLIGKGILALGRMEYPFAVDRTFMAQVQLDAHKYADDAAARRASAELRDALAALPGVRQAAIGTNVPGSGARLAFVGDGDTTGNGPRSMVSRISITPEYFDTLHLPVVRGRGISTLDRSDSLAVAVVSEDFARRFLPNVDPLGRRFRLEPRTPGPGSVPSAWLTVVGVVPKVAVMLQSGQITETVFVPYAQAPEHGLFLVASTNGDPRALAEPVRRLVSAIDPDLPVARPMTLRDGYDLQAWPFRIFGGLFVAFGLGALALAAAGLYGVMAFSVRRRTGEIGIRMALGADRGRILKSIVRQGLGQVALGAAGGLVIGRLLAGQLSALFFNVSAWDPVVFATTMGVLASVGFLATLVPAVKAASVDPLVALRRD